MRLLLERDINVPSGMNFTQTDAQSFYLSTTDQMMAISE
jgi:hypothetical protein